MTEHEDADDAALVAAINAGPPGAEAAFAALYRRHRGFVLRVARRATGDDAAAEDVAQEVFLALLGKFPGFRLTAQMTTFLYPLTRRAAAARARQRTRLRLVRAEEAAGPPQPAGDTAGLFAAVEGLPEAQREVLLLRVVDGLSVAEVSEALRVPEGTVKSRLHAALAALREDGRARAWLD